MSQNTLVKRKKSLNLGQYVFVLIFAALFIAFVLFADNLSWTGVTNILRHSAVVGLLSYGMGMIIITGDIDLSVGSMLCCVASFACAIANLLMGTSLPPVVSLILTILFCLVAGALLGFLNGILIGKVKLPAFIVTLATSLIFRSSAKYAWSFLSKEISGSSSLGYSMPKGTFIRETMFTFGNGHVLTIPNVGLVFIAIGLVLIFVTTSTKYGKRLFAVGSNTKAAHMAGINVDWTRVSVFTLTGLLAGAAAVLELGLRGKTDPTTLGINFEMFAIAAAVLGGIAMSGGKGKLVGVIFGALSYSIIDKIIVALHLDSLIQDAVKGLILLIAIVFQIVSPKIKNLIAAKKAK